MERNKKYAEAEAEEVKILLKEVGIMKQLIKEATHPLSLLRELISNSGAKEVGAEVIKVKYTVDEEGHIFEVWDNGRGMDYTGDSKKPGRLDKFLGFGLTALVGAKNDEFSWKGLGSKLAYQSKRIEIDTWPGRGKAYRVDVNEPWSSIERDLIPKPQIFKYDPDTARAPGTSIKVFGYPPYGEEAPFTFERIENYLLRRTFFGFTRGRENTPRFSLSIFGQSKTLEFGFPELKYKESDEGTVFVDEVEQVTKPGTNKTLKVTMKGFYTWDEKKYGLGVNQLNTGLILSVKGIPYLELDMEEYGSRSLSTANPGFKKCCLIVECDDIQEELSISRSGLVFSELSNMFKEGVSKIFERIEKSPEYLEFRRIPVERTTIIAAEDLDRKKQDLESQTQNWVVYQRSDSEEPIILSREPKNEYDVLCIAWKMEVLEALPFTKFRTLAHAGKGPDLIVHFQEDEQSNPDRYASIEVENKFTNFKLHGHKYSQYPRVLCWEIGKTPKIRINKTDKKYKHTSEKEDVQIHIYSIRLMDGIKVVQKSEFEKHGIGRL